MKKRVLRLVMVAVLIFVAVVPMMGCERELTFEEYREIRLEQLQSHVASKSEADFTAENWATIQEYLEYWLERIDESTYKWEAREAFMIGMDRICRLPRTTLFAAEMVETEHFRLTLYVDRFPTTCHRVWITTSFENISDTDFYIVSRSRGTGWIGAPINQINSLSFGENGYEFDEMGDVIFIFRRGIIKSGEVISNTYLLRTQLTNAYSFFYVKTKCPYKNRYVYNEILMATEFIFRGEN
ncbi:MAG: hypothetical protein FWC11_06945 [Firmicutes bacterium]|nr:hypothetical protein [Bacillota bacterium]